MKRRGFTLIELLISIAIIGLLTALLITNIDRSLDKNKLSDDIDVLRSKLEETRLMAGSIQQADSTKDDKIRYYGLLFTQGNSSYDLVKIGTGDNCSSNNLTGCIIENIPLSKKNNINYVRNGDKVILGYKLPQQQLVLLVFKTVNNVEKWGEESINKGELLLEIKDENNLTAEVTLSGYSGKLDVEYMKDIQP
jgi:prepilin-type N-terminal cleavage/methylation domain-containing protein